MNNTPVQKPFNLCNMGTSLKLLFSGYLVTIGTGYIFALIQILFTHGMADGSFGLSLDDIVYSYYGDRSGSVMESKLNGSMKYNAPDAERFKIVQWVRDGAKEKEFNSSIKPIFDKYCTSCHTENAGYLADFSQFEAIKKLTQSDEGATFQSLTRVSHIHLFGISFIFMFVCLIFSFSTGIPRKFKYPAIIMPFLFLLLDIASWWLTKINPHFALLVVFAGVGLGLAFAFMWLVSMYQMWFLGRRLKHRETAYDRRNSIMRD